jgi:hypothetical protein
MSKKRYSTTSRSAAASAVSEHKPPSVLDRALSGTPPCEMPVSQNKKNVHKHLTPPLLYCNCSFSIINNHIFVIYLLVALVL